MARVFPNWLSAFMDYTSDSESPDDFRFWSGVSTLAGALRRRVWLDMRKFQWTPNFYIILVGPPGIATKSTAMRSGLRLLERVDGVRFGPPSITWQKLADSLAAAIEHMKWTDPNLGEVYVPMSCLTIPISELGTFLKIDDSALIDVLVDLWDGQLTQWSHATKTSGTTDIRNPWLNIIGCTTPAWLKAHFPDHLIGGGLTSRIIFVYGEAKRALIPYPDEIMKGKDYFDLENNLVADLKDISLMSGPFELSAKARAWGHSWYSKHWNGARPSHMASDRYGGYLARKQTHIHKLAIILAASRSSRLVIDDSHLAEAEQLLLLVEPHMIKVFESIGVVDEARHVNELLPFVRAHGFLTLDALWQKVMNLMNQKDFNEAVRAAHRGGLIRVVQQNGKDGISPASTIH